MTEKEFSRLSPGRTILDVKTDESVKILMVIGFAVQKICQTHIPMR